MKKAEANIIHRILLLMVHHLTVIDITVPSDSIQSSSTLFLFFFLNGSLFQCSKWNYVKYIFLYINYSAFQAEPTIFSCQWTHSGKSFVILFDNIIIAKIYSIQISIRILLHSYIFFLSIHILSQIIILYICADNTTASFTLPFETYFLVNNIYEKMHKWSLYNFVFMWSFTDHF